jgi:hypothetical protein
MRSSRTSAKPANAKTATKLLVAMTGKASPTKAAEGDEPVFAYIASLPQPQRGIAERSSVAHVRADGDHRTEADRRGRCDAASATRAAGHPCTRTRSITPRQPSGVSRALRWATRVSFRSEPSTPNRERRLSSVNDLGGNYSQSAPETRVARVGQRPGMTAEGSPVVEVQPVTSRSARPAR